MFSQAAGRGPRSGGALRLGFSHGIRDEVIRMKNLDESESAAEVRKEGREDLDLDRSSRFLPAQASSTA